MNFITSTLCFVLLVTQSASYVQFKPVGIFRAARIAHFSPMLRPAKLGLRPATLLKMYLIPTSVFGWSAVVSTSCLLIKYAYERWSVRCAEPNEWLIVIRDGKMFRAGVGLRYRASYQDIVVKIPACVHKVQFQAQQVTKEMQGVELCGFVMWSVFREADGPAKAYQFLDGMTKEGLKNSYESIRNMAESIIRTQVANMEMKDVISNRELIREVARESMLKVVKGWGVWLETVEITDVKILSKSLFDNLQCSFREDSRQAAELKKIIINREIEEARLKETLLVAQKQIDAQNLENQYRAQKELEAKQQEEKLMAETQRIRMARIDKEKELEAFEEAKVDETKLRRVEKEATIKRKEEESHKALQLLALEAQASVNQQKLELEMAQKDRKETLDRELAIKSEQHALEMERRRIQAELDFALQRAEREAGNLRIKLEAQRSMDAVNLKVLAMENSSQAFRSISELKVVNIPAFTGNMAGSVEALIPGLLAINQALAADK